MAPRIRSPRALCLLLTALAMLASACAGTDEGTTALAAAGTSDQQPAPTATAIATTAPIAAPAEPAAADPGATEVPPTAEPAPPSAVPIESADDAPQPLTTAPAESAELVPPSPTTAPEPTTPPVPTAVPAPTAAPTATPEPAPPAASTIALPAVTVVNLATGQEASLAAFSPTGPALLWFWAPH